MRAYISTYLALSCLVGLPGCADGYPDLDPNQGAPTLHDDISPDAGPTSCDLRGVWDIELSDPDSCAPKGDDALIALTIDDSVGSDDFATAAAAPSSTCGEYTHEVGIATDGCTITTSSLAKWCANSEPQCGDYELTLHVRDDSATVEGTYRKCWCGSPGAFGTKVEVRGRAVRR